MAPTKTQVFIEANQAGFDKVTDAVEKLTKGLEAFGTKSPRGILKVEAAIKDLTTAVEKQLGTLDKLAAGFDKAKTSAGKYGDSILTMQMTMKSFIADTEKMIMMQMRWYGARALLDAAVQAPMTVVGIGMAFGTAVDYAEGQLRRYGAMANEARATYSADAKAIASSAVQLQRDLGASFDEIIKSADRLLAAGVKVDTVKEVITSFAKLQVTFPEIEMNKFTQSIVGIVNTFKGTNGLKELASDAERMRAILDKVTVALSIGVIAPGDVGVLIQHLGQMSQAAGFSIDQMLALSVMITNLGSKAGSAGRLLSGFIGSLGTEKATENLAKMGIQIDRNRSIASQFIEIMTKIKDLIGTGQTAGLTAGGMGFLGTLVSSDRQKILIAINREMEQYKEYTDKIADSTGALNRAHSEMDATVKQSWDKLLGVAKEASLEFLKLFTGLDTAKDGIDRLRKSLEEVTDQMKLLQFWTHSFIGTISQKEIAERVRGWLTPLLKNLLPYIEKWAPTDFFQGGKAGSGVSGDFGEEDAKTPPAPPNYKTGALTSEIGSLVTGYKKQINDANAAFEEFYKVQRDRFQLGEIDGKTYYGSVTSEAKKAFDTEENLIDKWYNKITEKYSELTRRTLADPKKTQDDLDKVYQAWVTAETDIELAITKLNKRTSDAFSQTGKQVKLSDFKKLKIAAEAVAAMQKQSNDQLEEITKARLEREKAYTEYLYANNRISATSYYDTEKRLLAESSAMQKQKLNSDIDAQIKAVDMELGELRRRGRLESEEYLKYTAQRRLLEEQRATGLIKINEDTATKLLAIQLKLAEDVDVLWEQGKYKEAIQKAMQKVVEALPRYGKQLEEIMKGISKAMESAFSDFFFDAIMSKLQSFGDYLQSFLQSVARAMANVLAQNTATSIMGVGSSLMSMLFHDGGTMGESKSFRMVPAGAFVGAPRHHSGIGPGEHAAIIKDDEGVFTQGQMAALGRRMNSGGDTDSRPIELNVINQSSQPVSASNSQVKFTPDKIVISTILRDVQQNGPISQALRSRR